MLSHREKKIDSNEATEQETGDALVTLDRNIKDGVIDRTEWSAGQERAINWLIDSNEPYKDMWKQVKAKVLPNIPNSLQEPEHPKASPTGKEMWSHIRARTVKVVEATTPQIEMRYVSDDVPATAADWEVSVIYTSPLTSKQR